MKRDLELAKKEIRDGYSACLVKDGVIVDREKGSRLKPVLSILERQIARHGGLEKIRDTFLVPQFEAGSSGVAGDYAFADKVVGLAAFRLAYLLGARVMWGELTSSLAIAEARKRGVRLEYEKLVPAIMNLSQDDLCPMERMASQIDDDLRFYRQIVEGLGKRGH